MEYLQTVAFADDIVVLVVVRYLPDFSLVANESIIIIRELMLVGLTLAGHKTEAILITSRKRRENITHPVGNQVIQVVYRG